MEVVSLVFGLVLPVFKSVLQSPIDTYMHWLLTNSCLPSTDLGGEEIPTLQLAKEQNEDGKGQLGEGLSVVFAFLTNEVWLQSLVLHRHEI